MVLLYELVFKNMQNKIIIILLTIYIIKVKTNMKMSKDENLDENDMEVKWQGPRLKREWMMEIKKWNQGMQAKGEGH